jgi:hypothetical protein
MAISFTSVGPIIDGGILSDGIRSDCGDAERGESVCDWRRRIFGCQVYVRDNVAGS